MLVEAALESIKIRRYSKKMNRFQSILIMEAVRSRWVKHQITLAKSSKGFSLEEDKISKILPCRTSRLIMNIWLVLISTLPILMYMGYITKDQQRNKEETSLTSQYSKTTRLSIKCYKMIIKV